MSTPPSSIGSPRPKLASAPLSRLPAMPPMKLSCVARRYTGVISALRVSSATQESSAPLHSAAPSASSTCAARCTQNSGERPCQTRPPAYTAKPATTQERRLTSQEPGGELEHQVGHLEHGADHQQLERVQAAVVDAVHHRGREREGDEERQRHPQRQVEPVRVGAGAQGHR
jgi:hypothetical protein